MSLYHQEDMKSFIAKRVNSILVNLRYLRFKLLKYKENKKNICNTFDHNFKNIPVSIMRKVLLERYYFVLYDGALTLKKLKMALNSFWDRILHNVLIFFVLFCIMLKWIEFVWFKLNLIEKFAAAYNANLTSVESHKHDKGVIEVQRCTNWEREGCYRRRCCTAIAPFWFSKEHPWTAITPF